MATIQTNEDAVGREILQKVVLQMKNAFTLLQRVKESEDGDIKKSLCEALEDFLI